MTPGARVQAAIDLLEDITQSEPPADAVTKSYFRTRRYIGSKDRRAVTEHVYSVLRQQAHLDWWLARARWEGKPSARVRMIASFSLAGNDARWTVGDLFSGTGYDPPSLDDTERAVVEALREQPLNHRDMDEWIKCEYPEWLDGPLRRSLGSRLIPEMRAANTPAPVDLRVNTVKATREEAALALANEGIGTEPTPFSPVGLRVAERMRLHTLAAFRRGFVEVQDEGSQLLALLTDARPGMTVVDFCAGTGGKTLALAAAMSVPHGLEGRLWACDTSHSRLNRMVARLKRAGVHGVRRQVLAPGTDPWPNRPCTAADRVLVDAPCSGTGTWRRHPEAKWWLTMARLETLIHAQDRILESAARLVRVGGRLVYATCSLLREENEDRVRAFLNTNPGFVEMPVETAWAETIGGVCPSTSPYLQLSPAATETDGFFLAVLERQTG